jgi:hypothetical protein
MKIIKAIASFTVVSLFLSNCTLPAETVPFQANQAKETVNNQAPTDGSSKQEQKENLPRNLPYESVENLLDGSHRLCTEPLFPQLPEERQKQIYVWCFSFRKNGNNIVGIYTYRAPKDTARICVNGKVKDNIIRGSGYEIVEGGSNPVKLAQKDFIRFYNNGTWDDNLRGEKAANYLRVSMPHLFRTGRYTDNSNRYYAWIRYENITFDMNQFYQRSIESYLLPKQCPDY